MVFYYSSIIVSWYTWYVNMADTVDILNPTDMSLCWYSGYKNTKISIISKKL